jgi:hypothetical protein
LKSGTEFDTDSLPENLLPNLNLTFPIYNMVEENLGALNTSGPCVVPF